MYARRIVYTVLSALNSQPSNFSFINFRLTLLTFPTFYVLSALSTPSALSTLSAVFSSFHLHQQLLTFTNFRTLRNSAFIISTFGHFTTFSTNSAVSINFINILVQSAILSAFLVYSVLRTLLTFHQ